MATRCETLAGAHVENARHLCRAPGILSSGVLVDIGKFIATQRQHIAQALPGVIKILHGVTTGERASAAPVDDIIGHEGFEAAAQRGDELPRWRNECLFT
jgi:hypothetical protein